MSKRRNKNKGQRIANYVSEFLYQEEIQPVKKRDKYKYRPNYVMDIANEIFGGRYYCIGNEYKGQIDATHSE